MPAHRATRAIECRVAPDAREACLDEKFLRHILSNLLSNAVKYSDEGQRVSLEVRLVSPPAGPAGGPETPSQKQLLLTVTDAGIGIPQADLAGLFHTFHRAANVGNRPGTGMGLAIVKQFVDLHQGAIRVESKEGQGTTVRVWLPLGFGKENAP
jgi:signal transduction histidine kinase